MTTQRVTKLGSVGVWGSFLPGQAQRIHYKCSNPSCVDMIRSDKFESHKIKMTSDTHLQENPSEVLQRMCNIAPSADWFSKESRMERVLQFVEQRHFLALARYHNEKDLMQKISDQNHFTIRLTSMVRATDPTRRILFKHYQKHHVSNSPDSLKDLIINICFLRNSMSRQLVKLVETDRMPWIRIQGDRLTEESQREIDKVFLQLGGKIFFESVQPMRGRSRAPRRGYGELVAELVSFTRKAADLAELWRGDAAVERVAAKIRQIPGFGGKGFRCKEIILDLAEITGQEFSNIADQLVDWSVVGPGRLMDLIKQYLTSLRTLVFAKSREPTDAQSRGTVAKPLLHLLYGRR